MGFIFYAKAAVAYEGRASSTLSVGNYLFIYKDDGAFAIHGATKLTPLNYQGPKTKLKHYRIGSKAYKIIQDDFFPDLTPHTIIEARRRKEVIYIAVLQNIKTVKLANWSKDKVVLTRSEKELCTHIIDNIKLYLPKIKPTNIEREAPTPYGNIDIAVYTKTGKVHIIEVKRRQISVSACGQIARYARHMVEVDGLDVVEYVAAPTISKNALVYCANHGQKYIEVVFPINTTK